MSLSSLSSEETHSFESVVKIFSLILLFLFSPDDHSRVTLAAIEDDPSSTYINANYINVRTSLIKTELKLN